MEVKAFNGDLMSSCGWKKEKDRKKEGCGSTYYDLNAGGWILVGGRNSIWGGIMNWQRGQDGSTGGEIEMNHASQGGWQGSKPKRAQWLGGPRSTKTRS